MLYILLPTLLTVGLLSWAIDEFGGDDDNNDNEPANTGPDKQLDPETGRMVVKLNDDNNVYNGDDSSEQVFGYRGNDIVYGGAGNDALNLGEGEDFGAAGEGNDRIFGNQADDVLNGGAGNDFVSGGAGDDVVASKDFIATIAEIEGKTEAEALQEFNQELPSLGKAFLNRADVTDAGDDYIRGDGGDDTLVDTAGKNLIEGGPGNDFIATLDRNGTDTPDTVYGGSGDDRIIVDDGDKVNGGPGKDSFSVSVMEATDRPVEIQDYQRGERLHFQIETADDKAPELTYAVKNGVMSIQSGDQVLVNLKAKDFALVKADIAKVQGDVTVSAT